MQLPAPADTPRGCFILVGVQSELRSQGKINLNPAWVIGAIHAHWLA